MRTLLHHEGYSFSRREGGQGNAIIPFAAENPVSDSLATYTMMRMKEDRWGHSEGAGGAYGLPNRRFPGYRMARLHGCCSLTERDDVGVGRTPAYRQDPRPVSGAGRLFVERTDPHRCLLFDQQCKNEGNEELHGLLVSRGKPRLRPRCCSSLPGQGRRAALPTRPTSRSNPYFQPVAMSSAVGHKRSLKEGLKEGSGRPISENRGAFLVSRIMPQASVCLKASGLTKPPVLLTDRGFSFGVDRAIR